MQGRVIWFNSMKGFGFLSVPGQKDIFVHYQGIIGEGFRTLEEGQVVEFDLGSNDKGPIAINVRVLEQQTI